MTKRAILLNGPSRCGKDTAAGFIMRHFEASETTHIKFSKPLKDGVAGIFGLDAEQVARCEREKELQQPMLGGDSYREAQVRLFAYMHERYGHSILGILAAKRLQAMDGHNLIAIVSDAGRITEVGEFAARMGPKNVLVIRLHRTDEPYPDGHTFVDNRQWIDPLLVPCKVVTVHNRFPLEMYQAQIENEVDAWLSPAAS